MKSCQMKNYLYLAFIFCLMAGSLSAKKRKKVPEIKPDTCTAVLLDSAGAIHHFPMIMVGNALSFPDTVSIRLLTLVNDSLLNDTIHTMFGNKKELIDFFVRKYCLSPSTERFEHGGRSSSPDENRQGWCID